MKKLTAAVIICSAALVFSSCAKNQGGVWHESLFTGSKSSSVSMAASFQFKFTTQKITSVANLKTPDEIVYYHNGKQDSFTKYNPKFQTVVSLNAKRGTKNLEMLEEAMIINKSPESDNNLIMLEYKYFSGCASIYFPLNTAADGKYIVAQEMTSTSYAAQGYGFLSSPDKLIEYLNSTEKE